MAPFASVLLREDPKRSVSRSVLSSILSQLNSIYQFEVSQCARKTKAKHYIKIKRLEKDRKQDFTNEEIQTIFNHNVYLPFIFNNKKHEKYRYPYYWVPIISVLTGCRVEEICQMETESIVKEKGVWIYRLRELGESELENPKVKIVNRS